MQKLWLDTPRQSCRYTDEFKLKTDEVYRIFPIELKRLQEKSEKFAKTGCIMGFFPFKCYRRMQQILRLFNYVRKARDAAKCKSHKASDARCSWATENRFKRIGENMAAGFSKNGQTKKLCMQEGMRRMMEIPQKLEALRKAAHGAGANVTDEEIAARQQAEQSAAMLAMTCAEVTDEGVATLQASMEAVGPIDLPVEGPDDPVDDIIDENNRMLDNLSGKQRKQLKKEAAELDEDDSNVVVDADALQSVSSLLDASDEIETSVVKPKKIKGGPLKILLWTGPKYILTHIGATIGWVVLRLVWLVAFMIGSVFSLVKASLIFPVLTLVSVVYRALGWVFVDMGWEGDFSGEGLGQIGNIPRAMWETVGFGTDDPEESAVAQIIVQPARIASEFTGVWHPYKQKKRPKAPNLCEGVVCGQFATCRTGKCVCTVGAYPIVGTSNCGLLTSTNGCVCKQVWKQAGFLFQSNNNTFGCLSKLRKGNFAGQEFTSKGQCEVDLAYPSQSCTAAMGKKWSFQKTDTCSPQPGFQEVPMLQQQQQDPMLQQHTSEHTSQSGPTRDDYWKRTK